MCYYSIESNFDFDVNMKHGIRESLPGVLKNGFITIIIGGVMGEIVVWVVCFILARVSYGLCL